MPPASKPPVLLTIAGFDPSSGAGITADLQVFAAHGCFGTSAITALTVQSTRGVRDARPVEPELLRRTLADLQADLPPAGIKIGMLGSAAVVEAVAEFLSSLPQRVPVVLDPVLRSSSGTSLLEQQGIAALQSALLPLVDWITPNWAELAMLTGMSVGSEADVREAIRLLLGRYEGLSVIATGGDGPTPVDLMQQPDGDLIRLCGERVETTSNHGTGCAFSSALLCGLVQGTSAQAAAETAKDYIAGALRSAPGLGTGHGPMGLLWTLRNTAGNSEVL